jgi:hypothetical protein
VKLPETKYLVIGAAVLLVLLYLLSKRKTAAQTTQIAPPGTTPPGTTATGTTPPAPSAAPAASSPAFVPTTQQTLAALMAQAGKNLGNAVNALKQPTIIRALPPGITPVGVIPFTEQ